VSDPIFIRKNSRLPGTAGHATAIPVPVAASASGFDIAKIAGCLPKA